MEIASVCVPRYVRKRDGSTLQDFDLGKIIAAVTGAWEEARGSQDPSAIVQVARSAHSYLTSDQTLGEVADIERIQDAVEVALMRCGHLDVAKAYILYRHRRTESRTARVSPDPQAISDYIHASKYARWREDLGRRETYLETVGRVEDMHLRRFAGDEWIEAEIRAAFDMVREKRVLPSMRGMQFSGAAVEAVNARGYNCSATLLDRPRAFAEAFYLLLCGCGVGYSVQFRHVDKLPAIARQPEHPDVVHHVVADTIEGWADALDALVNAALAGTHIEFSYHLVRERGSRLKTSGGRAPGHRPLKLALDRIRGVFLGAQGRQLRPIEAHRIMCHAADAVLSGGIRRSAMAALFSIDDGEMMFCKADPHWRDREPWLGRANNSVVLKHGDFTEEQFRRVFRMTREFGEPGFTFEESYDHARNPCFEVSLDPVLVGADGSRSTGWAFCNLCEINAAKLTSYADFKEVAHAATLIGTLQAAYTDFPYLGTVTEQIVRRDALLGIGMTGMQDAPSIALNPDYQRMVAEDVVRWNEIYAERIGINSAARCTVVKPSGTTSLELGSVASGIHPHHARRYIRRVTADELEESFQTFRTANPAMCARKPNGTWVIEFPVEVGPQAALRDDLSAVDFLEQVRSTYLNWVVPGTARGQSHHNVSNTVTVRADEWDAAANYLWQHRQDFACVSFLPHDGDAIYSFAPFESLQTPEQERRWQELVDAYKSVDYTGVRESDQAAEAACGAGGCEWGPRG